MRILLEDIIAELARLMHETKSLRGKVLLGSALESIKEYKKLNEKK